MSTEAFIAACSPDELLGQVIQTLCPRYSIDAPHLLALRQVLSSAIVAPRKPPTLKRTRPDKRIGEIGSIYDAPRRSSHGINGPPVSANQSFYFDHKDPDFERLLPQVDRSRYEWPDEPASRSDSDSQESMKSNVSTTSAAAAQRSASSQPTTPPNLTSTGCKKKSIAGPTQEPKKSCRTRSPEQVFSSNQSILFNVSQKDVCTTAKGPHPQSIPTIAITSLGSKPKSATSGEENTAISVLLLREADIAIELPDTQDTHSVPGPSSALVSHTAQSSDTQDTVDSTQQSEVFSPPVDFVHFTPPTQESQSVALSQVDALDAVEPTTMASQMKAKASLPWPRRSLRSSSQSTPSTSSLGKRSRGKSETGDDTPLLKRSKPAK